VENIFELVEIFLLVTSWKNVSTSWKIFSTASRSRCRSFGKIWTFCKKEKSIINSMLNKISSLFSLRFHMQIRYETQGKTKMIYYFDIFFVHKS